MLSLSRASHRQHETKQLMFPISTMKSRQSRQKMSVSENSGKTRDHLLFYDEIRKLNVPDQTVQGIDVAQHTGKGLNCSWQLEMPAEYSRDNEYLLYGYR